MYSSSCNIAKPCYFPQTVNKTSGHRDAGNNRQMQALCCHETLINKDHSHIKSTHMSLINAN